MSLPRLPFNPNSDETPENTGRFAARPGGIPSAPLFGTGAPRFPAPVEEETEDEELSQLSTYPTHTRPPAPLSIEGFEEEEEYEDEEYEEGEDLDASLELDEGPVQNNTVEEPPAIDIDAPILAEYSEEVLESIEMLMEVISSDESTEVLMNGPDTVMFKKGGARFQVPAINFNDEETYHRVINEFVLSQTDTKDRISANSYLIEGQMEWYDEEGSPPILARVHIVAPPVVKHAKVTIAKKARHSYTVDDIASTGSMSEPMSEFLKATAAARVTTVFAGLSGAGKTTLLEAMSYNFDANDRIIVVEDTPELRLPISDTVYMTTTASKPGVDPKDVVSMDWLVRATNRMRPDRIIVGEVRGGEMAEFLIAANSGADGSMTTVHAANPRMTLEKMLSLAMKSESAKNEMTIRREIASTVQLIVQASLIDGKHIITHIEEVSTTIREASGAIATQTLFEYDRNTGRHVARNRPSEQLQSYMGQRGVKVDPTWFMSR